jgi:predicted ATPase/DNA-binding SARP family transcriptional activator
MLGAFDVDSDGRRLRGFRSVKNEALLAYLVLAGNRPTTRTALAGLLWPDQPEEAARRNLRQALFQLRSVLDKHAAALEADQTSVRFSTKDIWVDALAFSTLLDACQRHDHPVRQECPSCMIRYAEAVELYRGEFLYGLFIDNSPPLEEWILMQREWFHARCLEALELLAGWNESTGDFVAAHRYAQRQIELDPLREEAHRRAMRALALSGQRSAALAAYEYCWQLLETELGASPSPETEELADQIRRNELSTKTPTPSTVERRAPQQLHNLPPPSTTFVGRETEQLRLRQWLLDPMRRLITITGPGGVGKTRLSLAAAEDIRGAFSDGVWFVPLVSIDDTENLAMTVGQEMGLSFQATPDPWQQLVNFLAVRECLLILDNFEHLMSATVHLADLLGKAPRIKLLVTSRARLNLQAEHLLQLGGLALPSPAATKPIDALETVGALHLFLERACAVNPTFGLDEQNAAAITDICRLVEGLPLGIELAASWVESYTCDEIARAIRTNLDFLVTAKQDVPARQRSVRAIFDYSWRLLADDEQRVLAQLSVFRGEFGRDAALAVTQAPLSSITALVRQSLLRVVRPGRFVLHELLRHFASEQALQQAGADPTQDIEGARTRHAHYYLHLLAAQAKPLVGKEPQISVALLNADLDNLRTAWRWALDHGESAALAQALNGLARYYELAGLHQEADHLFAETLAVVHDEPLCVALQIERARACITLARYDEATQASESALATARRLEAAEQTAAALLQLGIIANVMGDAARAEQHFDEALPFAHHTEEDALIAEILAAQAAARTYRGAESSALLHQALAIYRGLGNRRREGLTLSDLAMVATRIPDWEACERYATDALAIASALGERRFESMTLNILAAAYAERRNYTESDRALHKSVHLARSIGYQIGEINALNNLGVNHLQRHQRDSARLCFEQALHIARQTNYRRGVGVMLNNLGNIASDEEAYTQAELLYSEALEIARVAEDHFFAATRLDSLGDVRRWQGDYAGALAYFLEAAELAAQIGVADLEANARADIGLISRLFGDTHRANRELTKALILARKASNLWCECRAEAAQALASSADDAARAIEALETAAERARVAEESAVEAHVRTALGAVLLEQGDVERAKAALNMAVALRRTLPGTLLLLAPLAHLADLQQRSADLSAAMRTVEEMLYILGERRVGGVDDPVTIYAIILQVLAATGDARVGAIAERACTHLLEQAARSARPTLETRVRQVLQCA